VEKFDNSRIRLKRPAAARQQDAQCTFDPYRTGVGISQGGLALFIVAGSIAGMLALLVVIALLVKR
jgi:hypothetical protein